MRRSNCGVRMGEPLSRTLLSGTGCANAPRFSRSRIGECEMVLRNIDRRSKRREAKDRFVLHRATLIGRDVAAFCPGSATRCLDWARVVL